MSFGWPDSAKERPDRPDIVLKLGKPARALAYSDGRSETGPLKAGQRTVSAPIPGELVVRFDSAPEVTLPWSLVRKPGELPRVTVQGANGLPTGGTADDPLPTRDRR